MSERYGWGAQDITSDAMNRRPPAPRQIPLQRGLLLEDTQSGWVGEVVRAERIGSELVFGLEDAHGRVRNFPLGHGYLLEGEPIEVIAPTARKAPAKKISRSGSVAVQNAPARVARASRIWVEGTHDAELVEKVWGHDLRVEGIVVEPLHGVDDLAAAIRSFSPAPGRRLGILVDHLVEGTKEQRIVAEALAVPGAAGNVKIVGHPFIDIWQAVKNVARSAARGRLEERYAPSVRSAARHAGRRGERLEAHPISGGFIHGSRSGPAGSSGITH